MVGDAPAAVLVEDPKGLPDVLLQVRLLQLLGHHRQELLEVNLPVTITVHLKENEKEKENEKKRRKRRRKKRKRRRTSLIMSLSSATVGFCPRLFMTVPSSLVLMVPKIHDIKVFLW